MDKHVSSGLSLVDAAVQAGRARLRPVCITSVTTILGLVPLLLMEEPLFHAMSVVIMSGLAVGTTNIKTWGSRPGVGYLGILHRMVRAESARAAAEIAETAPRAGAHTYWAADAVDQIEVEAAPTFTRRRDAAKGPICRTNHCIDPALVAIEGQAPHASSPVRFARMTALLAEGGHTVDTVRAIFANHDDGENSINRRPGDSDYATTNAVFVAVPAERAAWACRGPADMGVWYRLAFEK